MDSNSSKDDYSVDEEILYSDDDKVAIRRSTDLQRTSVVTPSPLTTMKLAMASRSAVRSPTSSNH